LPAAANVFARFGFEARQRVGGDGSTTKSHDELGSRNRLLPGISGQRRRARWAADGPFQQMRDPALQDLIGRQPGRIIDPLRFKVIGDARRREGGIAAKGNACACFGNARRPGESGLS
jgi:hypothetical protein